MHFLHPITLKGHYATLEPLTLEHHDALIAAVSDGKLWKLWYTSVPKPENMEAEIRRRLDVQAAGGMQAFVVRRVDTGALCGMTNFMHVDEVNRRVEIGATWYATSAQRTGINTECKLMLLSHAFENMNCIAVEFRTHWVNQQSRAAIARLGAKQDGILRNHQRLPDGSLRDTVVFSIIDSEWPTIKRHLHFKLGR
ncbi:GNAT family protein [Herbaspirillum sp. RTI4]|uniref:GNAT family N-acetyltransferase n=1 Tax=Herbaspirillum sp. RTI4 TaxID=3048640 RepID=UPI002AB5BCF3|nr:GNAT family protein [Herbaspirillum sp. RTI4]MDY7579725.1 GNAT family protein [Herbaspirillum sp. RTI4]MEA9983052.1 GNAT family protein [Herbaspirillum sp. RTI4]